MWGGFEARKFPRVKTDCKIYIQNAEGGKSVQATTENIGIGGVCIILERPLEKFSSIQLDLDLGDGGDKLRCDGRVIWTVPSRDFATSKESHDTGIEFLNLSESSRQRIVRLVKAQPPPSL